MITLFTFMAFIVFYAYLGYGLLVYSLNKLSSNKLPHNPIDFELPTVTMLIAAYNEKAYLYEKVLNSLNQDYPAHRLEVLVVSDGSTDGSESISYADKRVRTYHEAQRNGKMAAIDRIMPYVTTDIVVFTDANALLNSTAIKDMALHFSAAKVGVVAGEKRIVKQDGAVAEKGEGAYWKYESFLKKQDAKYYSTIGAAGELFAIRRDLYQSLERDTLLDDFMLSMKICENGYTIAYEPKAYAMESSSANSKEELKRKIRIAAGGIQSITRLRKLANPLNNPKLTFQYISHRVLRWTIVPWFLILLVLINTLLFNHNAIFQILMASQVTFYALAVVGFYFEQKEKKIGILGLPYYFTLMNYAAIAGQFRFLGKKQSVLWERAKRKD